MRLQLVLVRDRPRRSPSVPSGDMHGIVVAAGMACVHGSIGIMLLP